MSSVGYATLQVIPSMKGIESKLGSGLAGPMTSAGSKAGKTLGESTKSGFGSAFGGAKTLIEGLGLFEAAHLVKDFFAESISEARNTQKATAVTAARIKSTGDAAHVSAKQVTELGFALSKKTAIDHSVIQSGENMLLTFKNIRNEAGKGNDIFTQSTHTLVDLAAAMAGNGQLNPKTAAIQLGKALNDPVKGMTALARVGVQFTDQQKAQITAMVAHNNLLGAQKVILKELNSEFAGSAAAQATAGEKMANAWHIFEDEIGTALLPTLDKLENWLLKVGPPAMEAFLKWFKGDGIKGIQDFGQGIADTAKELLPLGKSLLQTGHSALPAISSALKSAVPLLQGLADAFNSLPRDAQKMLVLAGGAAYLNHRLGGMSALLPTIIRPMGLLGSKAAAAGGAAGGAAPRFAGLKSALGTAGVYAAIAVAMGAIANAASEVKDALSSGPALGSRGLPAVLDQMNRSGLADFLRNAGADVDTFAKNLHNAGAKGLEVRAALEQIDKQMGNTNDGFSRLGGWKVGMDRLTGILPFIGSDLQTGALAAFNARKKIEALISALKDLHKQARADKATRFDTAVAIDPALAGLRAYRDQLLKLPNKVLTQVETPGAIQSVKDVEALQKTYHLAPREVRTIMKAEDFATAKIHQVMKDLGAVHKKQPPIPVTADVRKANQQIDLVGHGLFKLDKTKTNPKIDANGNPAIQSARSVLKELGVVNKAHPMANIDANNSAAMSKIAAVKNAVQSLTNHPWSVFIGTTGPGAGGAKHATGGLIVGSGTGTSDSIPARLSNGEFVVNAAATRRHLALLQGINAQRFAAGGQVGGSSSSGGPTVLHLYDIDGRLMGTMRAVARQEQDDTSSFDRSMAGRR